MAATLRTTGGRNPETEKGSARHTGDVIYWDGFSTVTGGENSQYIFRNFPSVESWELAGVKCLDMSDGWHMWHFSVE